ncbi:MAG: imidazoleglycerol-phosphate dehydratase HisB [Armatimonadota bacterium]|nr:imidazoleglycerol-phosphate dehydratase HisB [Armatimonadota bacterium]MDR7437143.1 imidazoleglycerol-phosphate dehydratase HisB [Armatimonadota bacterium]MDR7471895.1 imidazoleglycerol-phosphate dehydratase HisB [Armatimonadota bacterium]MDR7507875.1 imidazoleglycerol-phosphate dehydratase HisB [Armatimonadota bacterium]MDR7510229.1 imidazoleglycerol-phosphate dehydratase HisB [Armatimonadota bacterium]
MSRVGRISRQTTETDVQVALDLDGSGEVSVDTGVPFFDHMLAQLAAHGRLDLQVRARGDLAVDPHHTVEDVGLALGQALRQAVGEGRGIARFGSVHAPMDDALVLAAVDISGRPYLHYGLEVGPAVLGTFPADLAEEFFRALASSGALTLHLVQVHGRSAHHVVEAAFKGTGIALHLATRIRGGGVPSTKGVLGP